MTFFGGYRGPAWEAGHMAAIPRRRPAVAEAAQHGAAHPADQRAHGQAAEPVHELSHGPAEPMAHDAHWRTRSRR